MLTPSISLPPFPHRSFLAQFSNLGKPYNATPGHYLIVGPSWDGIIPAGIAGVVRSSTNMANIIPRIFLDDTPDDLEAIQPLLNQVVAYPLSQYDGTVKTVNWRALPSVQLPSSKTTGGGESKAEAKYVFPETFFNDDQFGLVLDEVAPFPGEEALVSQFKQLLDVVRHNPALKASVIEAVAEVEEDAISPFMNIDFIGK